MKKALVLALMLVVGLSAFAWAQAWEGDWSTTISFSPSATVLSDLVTFSSSLDVTYTVGGWDFESKSGFNASGLSSLSFKATGTLGAFTFTGNMAFKPLNLVSQDIKYIGLAPVTQTGSKYVVDEVETCLQTPSWTYDKKIVTKSYAPAFDKLTLESSVSIAGIDVSGLLYLKGVDNAQAVTYSTYEFTDFPTQVGKTGTTSFTYVPASSSSALTVESTTKVGTGGKLTVSGSFAGATVTSYTFFNLTEPFYNTKMAPYGKTYLKDALKLYGTPSGLACDGCSFFFNREYVLIEGIALFNDCLTLDASFDFSCCDFEGANFLFKDIDLGIAGITLDFEVSFTTTSKTMELKPEITFAADCFTIAGQVDWADNTISGIEILGLSYSHDFNGVTVSFAATFNPADNPLVGRYGLGTITHYGASKMHFWIPDTNASNLTLNSSNQATQPAIDANGSGNWAMWDVYCSKEVATVINKLSIDYDGDSCCGGAVSFSVDTYFGTLKRYTLQAVYGTYYIDLNNDGDFADTGEDIDFFGTDYEYTDATGKTAPTATVAKESSDPCLACSSDLAVSEYVKTYPDYGTGTDVSTLLGWIETDADFSVGVGSGFSLTAGIDAAWYGWKSLSIGLKFEW